VQNAAGSDEVLMSKKILILTGDGGESYETWFAVTAFRRPGMTPTSQRHRSGGCIW